MANAQFRDDSVALPRSRFRRLASRMLDAVRRARCDPADRAWVESILSPVELRLWIRMSAFDQYHAVQSARSVERALAGTPDANDSRWLAAALLHDVGKLSSNLSSSERVIATLAGMAVTASTGERWAKSRGFSRRLGLYLTHGPVGAAMIRNAGGREEVAAWAEVHERYRFPDALGIPAPVIHALSESDDL